MAGTVAIQQGDVYWADLGEPMGSEPGYRRPVVVIQSDRANRSAIQTVLVCALSTNLRLVAMPGNVALTPGEGGLTRPSVVVVSQVATIDRQQMDAFVGALSRQRMLQITAGVAAFITPTS